MSIKQLGTGGTVPVDLRSVTVQAILVNARTDNGRADGTPKTDEKGRQLWAIDCLAIGPNLTGTLTVTVAANTKPVLSGAVSFTDLEVGAWQSDSGRRGGLYWRASAVRQAGGAA